MSPLIKKLVLAALAVVAGLGAGVLIDKFVPLKDKAGNPVSLNPLPKKLAADGTTVQTDFKKVGLMALFAGIGAVALYFVGKITKISFLKS